MCHLTRYCTISEPCIATTPCAFWRPELQLFSVFLTIGECILQKSRTNREGRERVIGHTCVWSRRQRSRRSCRLCCQDFNELLQIFSLVASTVLRNLKEKKIYIQNTWQLDIKNLLHTQISVIHFFLNG